jgi:glycosyl-4,4'-diaponeurosporenoate acyltransferase
MSAFSTFDFWFQPKWFESERLYKRLGVLLIKRYVPTGGDLVMQRLRRHHPERRWVSPNLQSLCRYERRTRLNESMHVIGSSGVVALAAIKFASGSLTTAGLTAAIALNLIFGLWPIILQRYNRLRLYRAIERARACRISRGTTDGSSKARAFPK